MISIRGNGLIALCLPSAIRRLIVSPCVLSSNGHALRSMPHVGEEILKALPFSTNPNSLRAIPSVSPRSWVVASLPHCHPTEIRSRQFVLGMLDRKAVGRVSPNDNLSIPATATCGSSRFEMALSDISFRSASADAQPISLGAAPSGEPYRPPSRKSSTGEIPSWKLTMRGGGQLCRSLFHGDFMFWVRAIALLQQFGGPFFLHHSRADFK